MVKLECPLGMLILKCVLTSLAMSSGRMGVDVEKEMAEEEEEAG